jgi:phosphatidylserine synthase 2
LPFRYGIPGINLLIETREQTMDFIVTHIDPSLKLMNYEEVSYAEDCRMVNHDSPNPYSALYNACFDIFALAHFGGWFFKTLICRDLKLIMIASVSFEIIEYSLRNVLNNFKECWWDHVIIDIFGCNLLGIACAFVVIDKLGLDRYRWSLRSAPLQHSHW